VNILKLKVKRFKNYFQRDVLVGRRVSYRILIKQVEISMKSWHMLHLHFIECKVLSAPLTHLDVEFLKAFCYVYLFLFFFGI
jgi:hypothetical protein